MLIRMPIYTHSSRPHHDPAAPLLREVCDRRRVLLGSGHGRIHRLGPPIIIGGAGARGKATETLFRTDSTGVAGRRTIGQREGGLRPEKAARRDEPTLPPHPGLLKHRDQSPGHHSQPVAKRQQLARTGAPAKKSARPPTRGRALAEMRLPKEMTRVRKLPCDTHLLHTRDPGRLYHFLCEDFQKCR